MKPQRRLFTGDAYNNRRRGLGSCFRFWKRKWGTKKVVVSPCGKYKLMTCEYWCWLSSEVSRGIIRRTSDNKVIADIKKNHSLFWHQWIKHPNGDDYLLCGEDLEGYSVINLNTGISNVFYQDTVDKGGCFCWTKVYPSPDRLMLAVDGCYWASPYEVVFFDFRDPEKLPLPVVHRIGDLNECEGWADNETFVLTREVEYRKSDGMSYEELPEAEQELLDADHSLTGYRSEQVKYKRPDLG